MMNEQDEQLYRTWDQRWQGPKLTFLGKQMFSAKKKKIEEVTKGLEIKTVVEVGCGLGHTLVVYEQAGYDALGIDVSAQAVGACKKRGLKAELKKLEDMSGEFDLVSSDGMLEHFLNFKPHAHDLMRISKRYVLLIQPNHGSFCGKTLAYLAELLRGNINVFEYNYRIKDFIDVFEENGFGLLKSLPIFCDVFRLLLFEKGRTN
jgi:SAM-dependent methyltransferase